LAECTESGVPIGKVVRRFLKAHSRAGSSVSNPLFPRWERAGPAFGHSMAKGVFTARLRELRQALQSEFPQLGLWTELFSAHSLRRGGAIAMAESGGSKELIKLHGMWRSDAVEAYLQPSLVTRRSVP
jgi:hypothetical protein